MDTILLTPCFPRPIVELAASLVPPGHRLEVVDDTGASFLPVLEQAAFLIGLPRIRLEEPVFAAGRRLRLVQLLRRGHDRVDLEAARRWSVPICGLGAELSARAVAEHALLLILAVARRLPWQYGHAVRGEWAAVKPWKAAARPTESSPFTPVELNGKCLGIIGMGASGSELARIVRGLDLEVVYYSRRRLSPARERELAARPLGLEELLTTADVVSLHLPLDDTTRGVLGAPELRRMKRGAILVNTARGALVDEAALVQALDLGHLAGAGIDVLSSEPPSPDHPLLGRDDVVLTPHSAWLTREAWPRLLGAGFENIRRVLAGADPDGLLTAARPAEPI